MASQPPGLFNSHFFLTYFSFSLDFFSFKLAVIQLGVEAFLCQQLPVFALLHNVAVIHHQDPIRVADGGQAMGDDKASAALHQTV